MDSATTEIADRQAELNSLCAELWPAPASKPPKPAGKLPGKLLDRLISDCATAENGQRSERDFALCAAAVRQGWNRLEVWRRAASVGKFAEQGQRYFDLTWQRAEAAAASDPPRKRGAVAIKVGESALDLRNASARTDIANAKRLVALHGDNLRWCDPWANWLVWDGRRWAMDNQRRAEAAAKEVSQAIWDSTGELLPDVGGDMATELVRFAKATAGAKGVANMLSLARSETNIPILPDSLDSHAWLLNCKNGVVDLRTGKRTPHDRGHYLTKLAPHDYVQGAEGECPLFEEFLATIFADNGPMIRFVQRLFGCALVGQVIEHALPIFYGKGANGKSVLIETMLYVFGDDYACKAASDLLLAKRNEAHPCERADLHGKRLVACVETDENRQLAEGLVKELTGGDTIKARRMRENFWSFKPQHTAILVSNHKPEVRGTDNGIWRRLRLVPFVVTIPLDQQDKRLAEKLQAEACGILRWCVDGCLAWQREGLGEPAEVMAATADYREQMDVLAAFLADCCEVGPLYKVKAAELYAAYVKWCEGAGEKPKGNRVFGETMTEREFERRTSNGTWYFGVGLRG